MVVYLCDCVVQVGLCGEFIVIEDIGLFEDGCFIVLDDMVIGSLFKLYLLEDLMIELFGQVLFGLGVQLLELVWKVIFSNKGVLLLLWECYCGYFNLLVVDFDDGSVLLVGWVCKLLFLCEGVNVVMYLVDGSWQESEGLYIGLVICQVVYLFIVFEGGYLLVGSWIVGDQVCGMGICEDNSCIICDSVCFVLYVIIDEVLICIFV